MVRPALYPIHDWDQFIDHWASTHKIDAFSMGVLGDKLEESGRPLHAMAVRSPEGIARIFHHTQFNSDPEYHGSPEEVERSRRSHQRRVYEQAQTIFNPKGRSTTPSDAFISMMKAVPSMSEADLKRPAKNIPAIPTFEKFTERHGHLFHRERESLIRKAKGVAPRSWEQAARLLQGRGRARLSGNARLEAAQGSDPYGLGPPYEDNDIHLMLHHTPVVTYHPNEEKTIRTGGWNTPTTRSWMNDAGVPVKPVEGSLQLLHPHHGLIPVIEGMRVDQHGRSVDWLNSLSGTARQLSDAVLQNPEHAFALHDALLDEGQERAAKSLRTYGMVGVKKMGPHRAGRIRKAATILSSPSTTTKDIHQATRALTSPEHKQFRSAAADIFKKLGISSVTHDAIGSWKDGAENSVAFLLPRDPGHDAVRKAAAHVGQLAHQKSVIAFHGQAKGPDRLHLVRLSGQDLPKIHEDLLSHGIDHHTLVPVSTGNTNVLVFDKGNKVGGLVRAFGKNRDAKVHSVSGQGEFVGDPSFTSPERASSVYQDIIAGKQSTIPLTAEPSAPPARLRRVRSLPAQLRRRLARSLRLRSRTTPTRRLLP